MFIYNSSLLFKVVLGETSIFIVRVSYKRVYVNYLLSVRYMLQPFNYNQLKHKTKYIFYNENANLNHHF